MPDELERQLEAFGRTLGTATGEPIADDGRSTAMSATRAGGRWWASVGAAACLVAVMVGLVVLAWRDPAEAPTTGEPPVSTTPASTTTSTTPSTTTASTTTASTTTSVPMLVTPPLDPERLRSAPISEVVDGCESENLIVFGDFVESDASAGDAFARAWDAIVEHASQSGVAPPVVDGWAESAGDPITVRYLERGSGVEVLVRVRRDGDAWRVTEVGQCLRTREPAVIQTTTTTTTTATTTAVATTEDPLALERDGWSLVQRTTEPFSAGDIPCEVAEGLADFDGAAQVHDILTPPDGAGLDLDIQVIDVGTIERGNRLADVLTMIGRCGAETMGIEGELGALSSIRASWFRVGPDFALVTIVGEGPRSIVMEIEGAPFDDDLIGDLANRADQFLRGVAIAPSAVSG